MNSIFNIRRQGLLIYRELLEKYRIILGLCAIAILIYLMTWSMCLLLETNMSIGFRSWFSVSMLTLYCFLCPFILYKKENRRIDGIFYGISPASPLEKTISMFTIVTLIFPAVISVLMLSVDSLLSSLPLEYGFSGHIWEEMFSSESYISSFIHLNPYYTQEALSNIERILDSVSSFSLSPYAGILLSQAPFVFFAMLFRKHKIGKTLITLLAAGFVLSMLASGTIITFVNSMESRAIELNEEDILDWAATFVKISSIVTTYIIPVVFWILTYFRIRKIQY